MLLLVRQLRGVLSRSSLRHVSVQKPGGRKRRQQPVEAEEQQEEGEDTEKTTVSGSAEIRPMLMLTGLNCRSSHCCSHPGPAWAMVLQRRSSRRRSSDA